MTEKIDIAKKLNDFFASAFTKGDRDRCQEQTCLSLGKEKKYCRKSGSRQNR